ncbi:MAG: 3'-5' exoribonuclease [Anaerolineae bacterium]|nr:3'-5' exoribonuclease [Anaerolineae bacterium]
MRGVLVAIDLETTGLDVSSAQIIEIGAVKFSDHQIIETYTTLVDPESPIPAKITAITGIHQEKLVGAPKIADVLPRLRAFVGDAPVVGHNIDFDLGFLRKRGILTDNIAIDTYELASVLLPTTPRYNLNALMQQLNLEPEGSYHRALADAQATARVYMTLWDRLVQDVPVELLQEIVTAAQPLHWRGFPAFADALQARTDQPGTAQSSRSVFKAPDRVWKPLQAAPTAETLDPYHTSAYLETGGAVASAIDHYEPRIQQIELLQAVCKALNDQEQLLVEAAAGTGRSLAYLLPAMLWAVRNKRRVVIAVNTASLQDQLLTRDIPLIKQALGLDIEATTLKGRGAYLCPRRLQALRRRLPTSIEELRVLAKVEVRLNEGNNDGDRISLRGPAEYSSWARLTAQDEDCTLDRCESRMDSICPFYRACRAAEAAHLVVINHDLLIADALTTPQEYRVLPDYDAVIVDEAHGFEEAVTSSLSTRLDSTAIKRRLADLGTLKTGLLGDVIASTKAILPDNYFTQIKGYAAIIAKAGKEMEYHVDSLFKALQACLEATNNLRTSEYLIQTRINQDLRNNPAFSQVKAAWSILSQFTDGIADAMSKLSAALATLRTRFDLSEDLLDSVAATSRHLNAIHRQLNAFIAQPEENTVYWVEISQDLQVFSLRSAPLHVAPLIQKALWNSKKTVILTGSTLRAGGSFDYIRKQLGAENARELPLTSPFDYQQSTLVYLPTDMPEPQDRSRYQQAVERGIIELAAATNGRLLALFTGYTQLRQVAQNIAPRLALGNIAVLDQSDGTSRQALLESFHSMEKAVLLGTRDFWEDVDLPADDLVALVIVRLPFAVPSDPVFAARNETYDNSFDQYTVPDAILRFRQGFDRLISARRHRGIVTVFDKRMISKSYGQAFLDSLPLCTVRRSPMAELGAAAKEWLNGTN